MLEDQASLNIELNAVCPHCDEFFDLFEIEGGRLNDDGHLIKHACPDGCWIEAHEKFQMDVKCPECGGLVSINGIAW